MLLFLNAESITMRPSHILKKKIQGKGTLGIGVYHL